jgi:hypothetical protein
LGHVWWDGTPGTLASDRALWKATRKVIIRLY